MNATTFYHALGTRPPEGAGWLLVRDEWSNGRRFCTWALPGDDGTLELPIGMEAPDGWRIAGENPERYATGADVYVHSVTWRLWALHHALVRFRHRIVYRSAWWALWCLTAIVGVECPVGLTLKGAVRAIGRRLEEERRAAA